MIASAVESLIYIPGFRQRQSTHFTYTWALLKDSLLGINEGVARPMGYIIHHIRSTTHSALHVTNSVSSISTPPPPKNDDRFFGPSPLNVLYPVAERAS